MKKKTILTASLLCTGCALMANQQATSNDNPAYGTSNVQAQLRLNIRENAEVLHFIRDTNDPKIVTKTYVLKYADAYSIRPYLREMVQTLRVDYNNAVGRSNPDYYNTYNKNNAAGTQKIFVPGAVECVKFVDGTNIVMISAEEYRFKSNENGMGIDELVETLDQPGIVNSSGQPKFIYFPANRSAKELQNMIKLVGANVSNDTVELIGGKDKIEIDTNLNCLFFNTALFSRKHIEDMLKLYDIPQSEVQVTCTVYELDAENDGMLGMDFQSWKNNDGIKLLQTGANFSHNYNLSDIAGAVTPDGTINTQYFNFQPKWNSKFLDFLVSKGKAKVVSSGTLTVANGAVGVLNRSTGILYAEATPSKSKHDEPIPGNEIEVKPINNKFKFNLELTPSITQKGTVLNVKVGTQSLIGYNSQGTVRTSNYEYSQRIMIGNGKTRFYLGGIEKTQLVSDVGGVPLLKDLPVIGWIFATEREAMKKSQLVVVAECQVILPDAIIDAEDLKHIEVIKRETDVTGESNVYGYGQYLL